MAIPVSWIVMLVLLDAMVHPSKFQTSANSSGNSTAEFNQQKATNMTDHIQNKTHQVLIKEQLVHCPSQSLCGIGSISGKATGSNCCAPCSCEDNCTISGSCCLDKALTENSLDILSRKGSVCVLSQFKPFDEYRLNTNDRFLMIGLCHTGFNDTSIMLKCVNQQVSPNGTDMEDHLPVSSVLTNETYRNRHCAYCNWEQDGNLKYWQTSFSCPDSLLAFPQTAKELLKFIVEEHDCNIFYHPPPSLMSFPCRDETYVITECNVTGNWLEYDSSTDWACTHYGHNYEAQYQIYKNVFCYICNSKASFPPACFGGYNPDPGSATGLTSFAALFNFIEDTPSEQQEGTPHQCPTGYRFDTYSNVCLEITCLPPFKYSDGMCKNVFSRVASQRYELFLRFNKASTFYTNCDICPQVSPRLIQEYVKIRLINMGYYQHVCGLNVLSTDGGCSLSPTNPQYFIIHVELYERFFHNPAELAKAFLNSSAFQLESSSGEMLCIELKPKVLGGTFYELESGKTEFDYVSPLNRKYTDPSNGNNLTVETYPEAGTCIFKPWVARLIPPILCPLVNISLSDYNVTRHLDVLCLDTSNRCFKPEEFILSDNDLSVLICVDSYFASSAPEYKAANEESVIKVLLSFVCSCLSILCLIITMVTYMLFPVLRTLPGLYTMALCVTLTIAHALFTFGAGAVHTGLACDVLGMSIHLTMLASVFLMNVCSIHMFRVFSHLDRQIVINEDEKRRHFFISLIYSYGSSAMFVIGRVVYSMITTGRSGYGIRVCFINNPIALLFAFTLPVMLLVVVNVVMFCIVIVKVSQLPDMSRSSTCRHHQKRFLIYIKLSSLTGVAWLFGFIAEISHSEVFMYLYIILIAGQGALIMLSFVCNKRVYKLYSSYRKQVSSTSTSGCHTILDNALSNSSYVNSNHTPTDVTRTELNVDKHQPRCSYQDSRHHEYSTKL